MPNRHRKLNPNPIRFYGIEPPYSYLDTFEKDENININTQIIDETLNEDHLPFFQGEPLRFGKYSNAYLNENPFSITKKYQNLKESQIFDNTNYNNTNRLQDNINNSSANYNNFKQNSEINNITHLHSNHIRLPVQNDVQSIYWSHFTIKTRSEYQYQRLQQFHTIVNNNSNYDFLRSGSIPVNYLRSVQDSAFFFQFRKSSKIAKPIVNHHQLRHLVKALTKDRVYYYEDSRLMEFRTSVINNELLKATVNKESHDYNIVSVDGKYNPIFSSGIKKEVLKLDGEKKGISIGGCQGLQEDDLGFVAIGTLESDLIVKNLSTNSVIYNQKVSTDENAFVNCIQMNKIDNYNNIYCTISCNSSFAYIYSIQNHGVEEIFRVPFQSPVNNAIFSPNGEMLLASGDFNEVYVIDPKSKETIMVLKGHKHFCFALSWHPTKLHCATGSQDKTTMIYDLRYPNEAFTIIEGIGRPIQSLEYSNDGSILCAGELSDCVHLYDANSYDKEQHLDFLGEISGCSFSPDSNALFIGIQDISYGSLIELDRWDYRSPINEELFIN